MSTERALPCSVSRILEPEDEQPCTHYFVPHYSQEALGRKPTISLPLLPAFSSDKNSEQADTDHQVDCTQICGAAGFVATVVRHQIG